MKKLVLTLPFLALAACASTPPAATFAPLDYSYLPPILLKVSQINVTDTYVPTPSQAQTAEIDPAPPGPILLSMLKQRLQPAGQPGTGTVTVQTAYVDNVNGMLVGQMTVDVNLASANGLSTGFTEASVSASQTAPTSGNADDMQAALYDLSKRLMTQMNVQLQYEIQKNMPSWVSWTTTGAPSSAATSAGASMQTTTLAPPPGVATVPGMASSAPAVAPPASLNSNSAVPSYLPGTGPTALSGAKN